MAIEVIMVVVRILVAQISKLLVLGAAQGRVLIIFLLPEVVEEVATAITIIVQAFAARLPITSALTLSM